MRPLRSLSATERVGLAIGLIMVVVIFALVLVMVSQSDQGPLEPTEVPTETPTIGPTLPATPASTGTPVAVFDPEPAPAQGSLRQMLGYAPDRLQDNSLPLSDIAQYANIEQWMVANEIEKPTDPTADSWDSWEAQLPSLAIPEVLAARGTDPIWMQTYGFGLHQVDQVLAVGSAPDFVLVMRGDFDDDALHAAWVESGYQAVSVNGVTYWSLYPADGVDLSAPASRPALGNMNNIVLLEDGTIIATARSQRLEQTLRAVNGSAPNLADNPAMSALLTSGTDPEQVVTAILLKGSVLEMQAPLISESIAASPQPELPQASLLLAGLRAPTGPEQDPAMVIIASYGSPDDATQAFARAQSDLAAATSGVTDRTYADRFSPTAMRVIASSDNKSLLLIQLSLTTDTDDWREIIEERDLGFLMWPR